MSGTDTEGLHEVTVIVENASRHQAIYELKTLLFEAEADTTAKDSKSKKKGSAAK